MDYSWLAGDALAVAPRLLGWQLVCQSPDGPAGGSIIEVEAYHGADDPASHAYRGLTPRTAPMFQAAGTIYVYRSYGLHLCLNLVTGPPGEAQAVLIRALWPAIGLPLMIRRRGTDQISRLANGPGNVGQALGLAINLSGQSLGSGRLQLRAPHRPVNPAVIQTSPRIGIKQAADRPWRFFIRPSDLSVVDNV